MFRTATRRTALALFAVACLSALPPRPAAAQSPGEVKGARHTELGDHRRMATNVTLYRNGMLIAETRSWTAARTRGFRGQFFVVCKDAAGNAIWVSDVFTCRTVSAVGHFGFNGGGSSQQQDAHSQMLPEAVGRHAAGLDVYHATGNMLPLHQRWKQNIRSATGVAQELRPVILTYLN